MILIAESGSTRTEWSIVDGNKIVEHEFTEGINPFFQNRREISRSIRLGLPKHFFKTKLQQVFYYGAGCNSDKKKSIVAASLIAQFKTPTIVESDLLAAARGLFLDKPGIACILGTGSNSCFYDGKDIVKNVKSAGYILGDEGSAAVLGRLFVADLLKELVPNEIKRDFYQKFKVSPNEIMDIIYNDPLPNIFLGSIAYFLKDYITNDYVNELHTKNLRSFFYRHIKQYDYCDYPIRFVGSMAFANQDLIKEIAQEFTATIDSFAETPMKGLIEFHANEDPLL